MAWLVLRDAIEVLCASEVNLVADHNRGLVEPVVELVEGQQLELWASLDDSDGALASRNVHAAGCAYRRGVGAGHTLQPLLAVKLLAGLGIEDAQDAVVALQEVQLIAVEQR